MPFKCIAADARSLPFPVARPGLWAFYKKLQENHWMAEDIRDWPQDARDWASKLSDGQRHLIRTILRFLLRGDQLVIENLERNFITAFDCPEGRFMFTAQAENENTHVETYTLAARNLCGGDDAKVAEMLLEGTAAVLPGPVLRKEAWAQRWLDADVQIEARIVAFMCIEGIFFSASFCALAWFKEKGLLPALSQSNDYILRDEGIHVQMGAALYAECDAPLDYGQVVAIVAEATLIEQAFAHECLPSPVPELNATALCKHVERRADIIFEQLGLAPYYNTECPFDHMRRFDCEVKANFFERASTAYKKGGGIVDATIPLDFTKEMDF